MTNYQTLPGAEEGACAGCGKRILWVVTRTGVRVPLDPVAPTYALFIESDSEDPGRFCWVMANEKGAQEPVFVSHFATCSKANDFSGTKRRR